MKENKMIIILTLIIILESIFIFSITKYDKRDVNRDGRISTQDYSIIKSYLINRMEKKLWNYGLEVKIENI